LYNENEILRDCNANGMKRSMDEMVSSV